MYPLETKCSQGIHKALGQLRPVFEDTTKFYEDCIGAGRRASRAVFMTTTMIVANIKAPIFGHLMGIGDPKVGVGGRGTDVGLLAISVAYIQAQAGNCRQVTVIT
jgi:hypothetical protein